MRELELKLGFLVLIFFFAVNVESKCSKGCDLALASYKLWKGADLTFITTIFGTSLEDIRSFNPQISNTDAVEAGTRINVPFSCDCINKQYLGHNFTYDIESGDTYTKIAQDYYANLTTVDRLKNTNIYEENHIPDVNAIVNVIVNCSCGNKKVSKLYGLFLTYPLSPGENLSSMANESKLPPEVLQSYNPDSNFNNGSGLVFIPAKDQIGKYPPLIIGTGISKRAIAGISAGGVAGAIFLTFCLYLGLYRPKKVVEASFQHGLGSGNTLEKTSESAALVAYPGLSGSVDRSVEFSYKELAKATNDFNIANKIGQGGFGAVYYAELRGEKAAIKKMNMQASKEFLAELKILTNVHHLNLVRLIGYCVEGSLFLVYEFIENGNLRQHLQGSGREPMPWSTRIQIALDSATGLEYIHEHTVPVYIHRDIKSENIIIDKNFRAKVADFGLTKLTEFGSGSVLTEQAKGTIGYMPPEYGQFGEVSSKTDVYAFGVVLYELISAKGAIVKTNGNINETTGLVSLFDDVLNEPDPREGLQKLVDPRLGHDCPLDSILEMAQIAKACTQQKAELRPSMREIVVALVTLSSSTKDWDVPPLIHENRALANRMSGR